MPTVTQVNDLKINKLTKAQYDAAVQAGTIGENEISIITDLDATPQVDSLPTADASQEGKIYQYIGDTVTNVFCTVTDSDLDPYPTITIDYTKLKAALDTQGVVLGESGEFDISYEENPEVEEGAYIPVISVTDGEAFIGETYFSTPEEAFASVGIVFSETPHYVQADYTVQTLFSNGYFYKCMTNSTEIVSGTASVEEYINSYAETPDPENIPTFIFNKEVFDACISDQGKPANTGTKVKFSYWADPDEGYALVKAEYNSGDFVLSMVINDYGSGMNETLAKFGFTTNFCPVEEREPTDEEWDIVEQQLFDRNGYIIVSLPTNNTYAWNQIDVQPTPNGLPDQTGQNGKFLTTDGTDASWSDKPLVNKATGTNSVCTDINTTYIRSTQFGSSAFINGNFTTGFGFDTRAGIGGTAIGAEAYATTGKNVGYGTAIGKSAHANGNASIAIGSWASANGKHSIQLGGAGGIYNYDDNTMNVCLGESLTQNYKLLLSDGTIPEARLADMTNASQGQVLTLDSNNNAVWATPSSGGSVPTLTWYTISTAGTTLTIADTSSAQLVKVYKNGLLLQPTEDYTISGTTLTTVSAMVVGDKITTEVF